MAFYGDPVNPPEKAKVKVIRNENWQSANLMFLFHQRLPGGDNTKQNAWQWGSIPRFYCHRSTHYTVHCAGDVCMPAGLNSSYSRLGLSAMYPGVKSVVWRSDTLPRVGLDDLISKPTILDFQQCSKQYS
jgi:hypothetical protein